MGARAVTGRIIQTEACVAEGAAFLCARHPKMAQAYGLTGALPLRLRPDGFSELLSAIISQQVSVASANAIWGRMKAHGLTGPRRIARASEDELREVGLSRQKIRYAQELSGAGINYKALRLMPTDAVIARLVQVPGIGAWTAEIYAMFSLGRADVFAPGDLALQEAAKILFELPERPKERAFREMAKDWAPWRSVAARLLWSYYRHAKQRDGIR